MKTWILIVAVAALALSNIGWAIAYHQLSLEEMQGAALLEWSNSIIKAGQLDCGKE